MTQNFMPSPWHPTETVERTITAGSDARGMRLDMFITRFLPDFSRQEVQKMIVQNKVYVNNCVKKSSYRLCFGDKITMKIPHKIHFHQIPSDIELPVIYEDNWMIAINKPAGIVVHPTHSHLFPTVMNCLVSMMKESNGQPKPVHRIDKDVSGILIIAKNSEFAKDMAILFHTKKIDKLYFALVEGKITKSRQRITRDIEISSKGDTISKHAMTDVLLVEQFQDTACIYAKPLTGRYHQIRQHLSHIGHPIIGDTRYGSNYNWPTRLALHAAAISFNHPKTHKHIILKAPVSDSFIELLKHFCRDQYSFILNSNEFK